MLSISQSDIIFLPYWCVSLLLIENKVYASPKLVILWLQSMRMAIDYFDTFDDYISDYSYVWFTCLYVIIVERTYFIVNINLW